jgi:hypothetical protein
VNTRRSYSSQHKNFFVFCAQFGIDPHAKLTERQLCQAVIYYVAGHKITTLPSYVSALANWAETTGTGPLPRFKLYERVKKGLNNYFGTAEITQPKTAITIADLITIYSHIDFTHFEDVRDWCAYVFAFFGVLRISEYINPNFTYQCVKAHDWGICLTIPYSKTCLTPAQVKLARRGDVLCPLAAWCAYYNFTSRLLRVPTMVFFRQSVNRSEPLNKISFMSRFKLLVSNVLHKDPSDYAGHSFRRGGTTALFLAGVPESAIALHGRWKSLTYRQYFQWSDHQQLLPTQQLLAASKIK